MSRRNVFIVASSLALVTSTITACCRIASSSDPAINTAVLLRIDEGTNSTDFVVVFSSPIYHGRRHGWKGGLAPLGGPLADGTPIRIEADDLIPFELYENYKRVPLDDDSGYLVEDQGSRLDLKCGSRCVRWSYPLYLYNYNNQFSVSVKNVSVCPVGNRYEVTSVDDGWILLGEKGEAVGEVGCVHKGGLGVGAPGVFNLEKKRTDAHTD